jgi:hypothetical protein
MGKTKPNGSEETLTSSASRYGSFSFADGYAGFGTRIRTDARRKKGLLPRAGYSPSIRIWEPFSCIGCLAAG